MGNITQGAQANLNGKVFEKTMVPLFETNGFVIFKESELKKKKIQKILDETERYVLTDVSYTTIYESKGRTEFVIVDKDRRIRVEAKFQAASGSVDEKYPYMLLNGIYKYPENEIIFVVDGGGYKPGAREWLKNQINNDWLNYKEQGKHIELMTMVQFINWFNHEFAQ